MINLLFVWLNNLVTAHIF